MLIMFDKMRVKLQDNTPYLLAEELERFQQDERPTVLEQLRYLSETTIGCMADKHGENLLVFPPRLNGDGKDMEAKDTVLSIANGTICTSNYMGFVGRGGLEVTIGSRFDKGRGDFFLHYMLQRVFHVNVVDLQVSKGEQSVWDLLIYLFPYYLKQALRLGMYKKYQRKHYNDSRVRGAIDVARHLRENVPFAGKIAYTTREYSVDNHLTQLIRHTIEYLANHPLGGRNILRIDPEMTECVAQVVAATPSYNRNDRMRVMGLNLKAERHPYYTEYTLLQRLCLQILRREKMSFGGNQDDKVYGLLFDGSWLWEKYVGELVKELGYVTSDNRSGGSGSKCVFSDKHRYDKIIPDFYKEKYAVLDAKYKWMDDKIRREDLHQMVTYMHCLKVDLGGFIYPKPRDITINSGRYGTLNGYEGDMYQFAMSISEATEYSDFVEEMRRNEAGMRGQIGSV